MTKKNESKTKRQRVRPTLARMRELEAELEARKNFGSTKEDEQVMRGMVQRVEKQALDHNFMQRVTDGVVEALLNAAVKTIDENTERRTAYLLAGCPHELLPSSLAVENAIGERLQRMAKDLAGKPIPAVIHKAGA